MNLVVRVLTKGPLEEVQPLWAYMPCDPMQIHTLTMVTEFSFLRTSSLSPFPFLSVGFLALLIGKMCLKVCEQHLLKPQRPQKRMNKIPLC